MVVLDALRGIAIAMVVIFHLHQDVPRIWPGQTAFGESGLTAHTLSFFLLGVDLFYVLSGFFIGCAVLRPAAWAPKAFLRSRLTRILPAYYVSLVLTLVLVQQQYLQTLQGWLDIGLHVLMLQSMQEWSMFSINGAYWTLSIELSFYLLMLALAPVWRSRAGWALIGLFLLVTWAWRAGVWAIPPVDKRYFWSAQLPGSLDEFAAGMAVAFAYSRGWVQRLASRFPSSGVWLAVLGMSLTLACMTYYVTMTGNYWASAPALIFSRSFLGLGFALLAASLLILQHSPGFVRAVGYTQLTSLGQISYSVYLYHSPLILLFFMHGQHLLALPWLLLATCVAIMAVSGASFQWIERRWHPSL